ncbi:MAG: hypothetical protein IPH36_09640 [Saprospiraceae bacterium]|nr:hypothetical protein [Saprospiraceae bacterium]
MDREQHTDLAERLRHVMYPSDKASSSALRNVIRHQRNSTRVLRTIWPYQKEIDINLKTFVNQYNFPKEITDPL